MAYDDAIKAGALAFFGDKYGDRVRVVRMGDFSVELCGGTHISRTGDVGMFKLEAESGVAAGVRRIEAVTGQGALETIRKREKILEEIGAQLGARDGAAVDRLEKLLAREKELEKKLRAMEQKLATGAGGASAEENVQDVGGVKVVTRKLDGVDPRTMREMADRMRQKHGSAVVALGSDLGEGKVALLVAVTPDLTSKIKAGDIIKNIAPIVGGTGGGRPDLAQAGGRDPSKLDEALAKSRRWSLRHPDAASHPPSTLCHPDGASIASGWKDLGQQRASAAGSGLRNRAALLSLIRHHFHTLGEMITINSAGARMLY